MSKTLRHYYRHRDAELRRGSSYKSAHRAQSAARARARYAADPDAGRTRKRREYAANPQPVRDRSAAGRRAHPVRTNNYARARRAREQDAFVEYVSPLVVMEVCDGICGICGEPIELEDFEVDHILSLVGGGEHSYDNAQGSHKTCNPQKAGG